MFVVCNEVVILEEENFEIMRKGISNASNSSKKSHLTNETAGLILCNEKRK